MAERFDAGQPGVGDGLALLAGGAVGSSYEIEGFDAVACVRFALSEAPGLMGGEQGGKKNSVAIASNELFGGWTKTFTGPRLCAAIVDRFAFNGTVI